MFRLTHRRALTTALARLSILVGGILSAAPASAAVIATNPNVTATATTVVTDAAASCVQTDAVGDFGTLSISGTVSTAVPADGQISVEPRFRETQPDGTVQLVDIPGATKVFLPGQTADIAYVFASDGLQKVDPVSVFVYTVSSTGVKRQISRVNTTGLCGWRNLAYVPSVVDVQRIWDQPSWREAVVTNTSDYQQRVVVRVVQTYYGTGGYVGTNTTLSETVDLAPNQSLEVPFLLVWNTCGSFDAFTYAGAGPDATTWPREGAHYVGTFDHYDGNAELPCDSDSEGEDD
ncbi:hypothetical protein HPC49_25805 [Pyxidicoccus fallax]|uniref:Lipoprotein n=1 Tax=Pyxidicoccus fallax TaxID=394095 RepID=A0A848LSU5_9BACT|nr:hypothetical protein [Pyxidicoccus fallax]NMO20739.1 hypothetical protein [Pyxidicoccus fallax]NPC81621.1 hypothetical protein [Pyxidicoccus fallax]